MATDAGAAERHALSGDGKPQAHLKILVLCYELPPVGGGGGRVALDVAQGLARRGHAVKILTSHVAGLALEETIEGVQVRRAFAARRRAPSYIL